METKTSIGWRLRVAALASCSLLALGIAPAAAQTAGPPTSPLPGLFAGGPVTAMYGKISPFYGKISPFSGDLAASYGKISPFYGKLSPFYGKLSPFWGDISQFYGKLSPFTGNVAPYSGSVSPFWGKLSPFTVTTDPSLRAVYGGGHDPFWGGGDANPYENNPYWAVNFSQIQPFWTGLATNFATVQASWGSAQTAADYAKVAALLQTTILNPANTFWGKAVAAGQPIAGQIGEASDDGSSMVANGPKSFNDLSKTVLTKSGVTFNADGSINADSLATLSPTDQAMLFLNLYDGLMAYTGKGRVDWWMGATGWTPDLAKIVGSVYKSNYPVTVGMLDFTVSNNVKNARGTLLQYGSTVFGNGHGAAVGSLIMGSLDGSNVLGVMPAGAARVMVYDPYDSTGTTNWTDVGTGIKVLANTIWAGRTSGAPVGVINASLGVPGWTLNPGWNDALAGGVAKGHNLVVAAGNEGVTQMVNVPWDFVGNPTLIVVGSIGLDGTISNFSNRPGEACLISTQTGACDKLKNHFIVAPGELIAVADGAGGVSRQTGTSLAAPLVTGAIALLQARWPWLGYYPNETAQIILKSATPLGAIPGADPIYGVGALNIAASQSPLSFSALSYGMVSGGTTTLVPVSTVISTIKTGSQSVWNSQKLYFTAIEQVGATHRDFQIPMASSLIGQQVATEAGQQLFQTYLAVNLRSWAAGQPKFAGTAGLEPSMASFAERSAPIGPVGGLEMRLKMAPAQPVYGFRSNSLPLNTEITLTGPSQTFRFGYGEGAHALDGQAAFAETRNEAARRGGANPLLGLASGGAFVDWRASVAPRVSVNLGVTQRRDVRDVQVFGPMIQNTGADKYAAVATHIGVDIAPVDGLVVHSALTRLHEDSALLGVQSLQRDAFGSGSTTDGVTFGFDAGLTRTLSLSATGTLAKTVADGGQSLQTRGLTSTAAQLALTQSGVLFGDDRVRVSVFQPMHVTAGAVNLTTYGVLDRQTGALGLIHQSVGVAGARTPYGVEALYGKAIFKGRGELGLFARSESQALDSQGQTRTATLAGAKFNLRF